MRVGVKVDGCVFEREREREGTAGRGRRKPGGEVVLEEGRVGLTNPKKRMILVINNSSS